MPIYVSLNFYEIKISFNYSGYGVKYYTWKINVFKI